MISYKKAKALVELHAGLLNPIELPLQDCTGKILAEDVFANIDLPPFHQSAMDGYAFQFKDAGFESFTVSGEIPAGTHHPNKNNDREAVRIFTGAAMPEGTDTVIIQENITVSGDKIFLNDPQLKPGGNVRLKGSEIRRGEKALEAGTYLSPAAIGFLAGLGMARVKVFPAPKISMLVTGKELIAPGESLSPGKIFESNSYALRGALQMMKIYPSQILFNDDSPKELKDSLNSLFKSSDIVIITGGISVGDYDFVKGLLDELAVETIFYKVKQRPGKPLFFGKINKTIVFALPGNPSSALSCFYVYVVSAIRKMMGFKKDTFSVREKKLASDFKKKEGLTFFLKGRINGKSVHVLHSQESGRMNSFALADCLIEMEEGRAEYKTGDLVIVHSIKMD